MGSEEEAKRLNALLDRFEAINERFGEAISLLEKMLEGKVPTDDAAVRQPVWPDDTPIAALGFNQILYNRLQGERIFSIGQLTAMTELELLHIRLVGPDRIREIRERLALVGRNLHPTLST